MRPRPPRLTARVNPTIYGPPSPVRAMRSIAWCRAAPEPLKVDREGQPYYIRAPITGVCNGAHRPVYSRVDPCGQPICIKLSWEVRQEAGPAGGVRVVDVGVGGP